MRTLLLGAQRATTEALLRLGERANLHIVALDPDICLNDHETLRQYISEFWDTVVHLDCWDNVAAAEQDPDQAKLRNNDSAQVVADACRRSDVRMVFVSTHQIFNGSKPSRYGVRDTPCPLNVFGATMLAAEKIIRSVGPRSLIVRTQDLFGPGELSRCNQLLEALRQGTSIDLYDNHHFAPTYTEDLARVLLSLLQSDLSGTVHVAPDATCDEATWVQTAAEYLNQLPPDTRTVSPAVAEPPNAHLHNHSQQQWTDEVLPRWQDSLLDYLKSG